MKTSSTHVECELCLIVCIVSNRPTGGFQVLAGSLADLTDMTSVLLVTTIPKSGGWGHQLLGPYDPGGCALKCGLGLNDRVEEGRLVVNGDEDQSAAPVVDAKSVQRGGV